MTSRTRTLIVGGASGMGKATARLLLEEGGRVVLAGRQKGRLEAAQQDLAHPGRVDIAVLDLADPAAVSAFSARMPTDYPDLTGLVNGAGVFLPKPFLEHAEEDYDRYLDLNRGTFFLTQAVAKAMIVRGEGGAIVNIGSMWPMRSSSFCRRRPPGSPARSGMWTAA